MPAVERPPHLRRRRGRYRGHRCAVFARPRADDPELTTAPRYATNQAWEENMAELDDRIAVWTDTVGPGLGQHTEGRGLV